MLIGPRGDRTHPSSSSRHHKNTSPREAVLPLYYSSSAQEAIHHTTHWIRVLHHNGGPNQYKPRVSCVVHRASLESRRGCGHVSVGIRSSCAPQSSNLEGLPEPEIRQHHTKVTVLVQRDQDQQNGRMEVTVEPSTASSPAPLAVKGHL